ncbi:MAG: hypothetical protein QXO22_08055 [Thermosphaera sp.]
MLEITRRGKDFTINFSIDGKTLNLEKVRYFLMRSADGYGRCERYMNIIYELLESETLIIAFPIQAILINGPSENNEYSVEVIVDSKYCRG